MHAPTHFDHLIRLVLRRRAWVLGAYLLLALAALPGTLQLRQDNSPEVFFVRDAAALEVYSNFEFEFGRDRVLRVILEGPGVWSRDGLRWMADFEQAAPGLRGVVGAAGLYGHHAFRFSDWPPADLEAFRDSVLEDVLDRHAAWVNDDGTVVTILVALYKLSPDEQNVAVAQILEALGSPPAGIEVSLAGLPVINQAMDRSLRDMAMTFFPILVVLASVLMLAGLGSPAQVAALLMLVGVCLVVPLGAMGYLGIDFNVVLIVFVPLLFVMTLATATHVLVYHRSRLRQGMSSVEAVCTTYRVKAWPVIWAGATTAVGFGSMMLSDVPPLRELGLWSAVSIAFMTTAMLTMSPALLSLLRAADRMAGFPEWVSMPGERWAVWAVRQRRGVIVAFLLSALVLVAGLPLLKVESNVLTYFGDEHPVRANLQRVQDAGIGVLAAELLLVRSEPGIGQQVSERRFDDSDSLRRLLELGEALRAQNGVLGGIGVADLVRGIAQYRPGDPADPAALDSSLTYMRGVPDHQRMLGYFLADDALQARFTLLVPMLGFNRLDGLFAESARIAQAWFPDAEVKITGQYPLVLAAQKTLLGTMLASLLLTLACIALIIRWLLGSAQLAVKAMVPNLWPVVFVLGMMGWGRVPVDSTTVMIAAAVLGLAVDDTLHALGSFRVLLMEHRVEQAVRLTFRRIAPAHVLTSMILALGFLMISLSSFVPVARFGALAGAGILAALVADLLLVPALLATVPRAVADKLKPVAAN